jgi:hypothetical protein
VKCHCAELLHRAMKTVCGGLEVYPLPLRQQYTEVNGLLHVRAPLSQAERPRHPSSTGQAGPQSRYGRPGNEKLSCSHRERNDPSVVQDEATPLHQGCYLGSTEHVNKTRRGGADRKCSRTFPGKLGSIPGVLILYKWTNRYKHVY